MASTSSGDGPKREPMCQSMWLRRQKIAKLGHHGSRVSLSKTEGPLRQQADVSETATNVVPVFELHALPEDLLQRIHFLMPLRDAARAACVSRSFLRSWRHFPYLRFKRETFKSCTDEEYAKKVHCILGNHSGTGLRTLELQIRSSGSFITVNHINAWLQSTMKPGILKLSLDFPWDLGQVFNFPCLLLSRAANSLWYLSLSSCVFHPTPAVGLLGNLKRVTLQLVHITEEELESFFSCAIFLEDLEISDCHLFTFLKLPSHLQRLSVVRVMFCESLNIIEIYAPKVVSFVFGGPFTKIVLLPSHIT